MNGKSIGSWMLDLYHKAAHTGSRTTRKDDTRRLMVAQDRSAIV